MAKSVALALASPLNEGISSLPEVLANGGGSELEVAMVVNGTGTFDSGRQQQVVVMAVERKKKTHAFIFIKKCPLHIFWWQAGEKVRGGVTSRHPNGRKKERKKEGRKEGEARRREATPGNRQTHRKRD